MRALKISPFVLALVGLSSCTAGTASGPAKAGSIDPDARSFESDGFSVDRPDGWQFIAPDSSVSTDAVMLIHGPLGPALVAPIVEIGRRELSAHDRRRKPSHILTSMVIEIVQTFAAADMIGEPEEITIADLPGGLVRMELTMMLGDGTEVEHLARFYSLVHGGRIWIIRCLGPKDGSAETDFDAIIGSIKVDS